MLFNRNDRVQFVDNEGVARGNPGTIMTEPVFGTPVMWYRISWDDMPEVETWAMEKNLRSVRDARQETDS